MTNRSVSALTASDSNLYAGTYNGGVFLTADLGANWINRGLADYSIIALAANGTNLFANALKVTMDNKLEYFIFTSTDNGETWIKVDSAANNSILSLAANSSNLYAGSSSGVVYQPVSKITSVKSPETALPAEFHLYQNYPNPFNPSTTIKYEISAESKVKLVIYNILGEKVAELVNAFQKPGEYSVNWNAKDFASGVYFYRLTSNSFIQSKKLLLLK